MKITLWSVMCLAALWTVPVPAQAESLLIEDETAHGRLFLPDVHGRPIQFAAEELRHYLEVMTGVRIPIAWRGPEDRDTGIQLTVRDPDVWKGEESAQAFVIEEDGRFIEIAGNTETAVVYGVYHYLDELGVKWYAPGEMGERVPRVSRIAIGQRREHHSPAFIERVMDFSGSYRTHFDDSVSRQKQQQILDEYSLWLIRNRLQFFRPIHRDNWFDFNRPISMGSGHGLRRIVLRDASIEEEPERYPKLWRDGELVRTDTGAHQICFTNETNIQVAIERVVQMLDEKESTREQRNADLDEVIGAVGMGLADSRGICECETCKEVGSPPPFENDRLVWHFYNRVIEGVNERRPDGMIWLYAPYMDLRRPPEDVQINPNIAVYTARTTTQSAREEHEPYHPFTKSYSENIRATGAAGAQLRVRDYVLWWGTPQPLNIFDAAQAYHELGYRHYHIEVMNRSMQLWPVLWTMAQFTWDSSQNPDELLEQYCHGSFGPEGGEVVLSILRDMDANSRNIHRIAFGNLYDTSTMLPDELIDQGLRGLEDAQQSTTGREAERLAAFKDTFEMLSRKARSYRAYCRALNQRSTSSITEAQNEIEGFIGFWEENGMAATCSPRILSIVKELRAALSNLDEAGPNAREGLDSKDARLNEIFAQGDQAAEIPEDLANLVELPEVWMFRVDYKDQGLANGWHEPDYELDGNWQPLSTWDFFGRQGYPRVQGHFWYRLEFEAPQFPDDAQIIMRLGSLDDEGEIYLNGELVYEQDDPSRWHHSFAFDVTPYLKQGETNTLVVRGFSAVGAAGLWRPSALYTR